MVIKRKHIEFVCQALLLSLVLYFIIRHFLLLSSEDTKHQITTQLEALNRLTGSNLAFTIVFLMAAHLICSYFSLPFCALINVASGYLLGFWPAILAIFSITFFSAGLGYATGRYSFNFISHKFPRIGRQSKLIQFNPELGARKFIYLVLLRLSPLFPFGVLNITFGYTRLPILHFFASISLGVFFNIALLIQAGVSLKNLQSFDIQEFGSILAIFFLFLFLYLAMIFKRKYARANSPFRTDIEQSEGVPLG
ncbi:MAG: VTT domain-containing protein [Bdellovibrionales bacterium]|nr:VTT domain-containing protein [Bdellovibrionales bacterium]